ncbi:unnamed protein product [Prunus armeniaca]
MSIPFSLQQELLMWKEEIEDYEMIKVDPKPFLPSVNNVDARFYNEEIAPLTVPELIKNGHSPVVMAQNFLQRVFMNKEGLQKEEPSLVVTSLVDQLQIDGIEEHTL